LANAIIKLGLAIEAVRTVFATNKSAPLEVSDSYSSEGIAIANDRFFEILGNSVFFESYNTASKTAKVYKECPPLNFILNQKNLQLTNGNLVCNRVYENGKKTPVRNPQFTDIINYPNPIETGKQFLGRLNTILKIFKYCPVLKVYASGFEDEGPRQLWILPPHKCRITLKKNVSFPDSIHDLIEKFELLGNNGMYTTLDHKNIYFYTSSDVSIEGDALPESLLETYKYTINNIIKNYESRGVITERRGALGILSPDGKDAAGPIPTNNIEKTQLQNDYRKYGLSKDQWQIIISTIPMKFTPMSMNIKDLMLLELAIDDIKTLCMALGFEFNLTPWGSDTAFANKNIGEKRQYQDFTIPEAENLMFQFTDCTGVDAKGFEYSLDYSHVPCLQADEKEKAEVRRNNVNSISMQMSRGLITYGRAMEILGEADSTPADMAKKFIWELPEEIQALYKVAQPTDNNNSQNQNSNNGNGN